MRIDLIVNDTKNETALRFITQKVLQEYRDSPYRDTNYHLIAMETKDLTEVAGQLAFIAALRRQLVPGMRLDILEAKQFSSVSGKEHYTLLVLAPLYGYEHTKGESDVLIPAQTHDVATGDVTFGKIKFDPQNPVSQYPNKTIERYVLTADFLQTLKFNIGGGFRQLDYRLSGDVVGCHYDEDLEQWFKDHTFSSQTPGRFSADNFYEEIILLGRTTGRKLIGFEWDFRNVQELEILFVYQPATEGTMFAESAREGCNYRIPVNYGEVGMLRPFMTSSIKEGAESVFKDPKLSSHLKDTMMSMTIYYANILGQMIVPVKPKVSLGMDWNALAVPVNAETFKMPQLVEVYERYKKVEFLLTREDEEKLTQLQTLYSGSTRDLLCFVTSRNPEYEEQMTREIHETMPTTSPEVGRGLVNKTNSHKGIFLGVQFAELKGWLRELFKKGCYAEDVYHVPVEGFVGRNKEQLTIVAVGIMRGVSKDGTTADIARTRVEK